MVHGSLTDRGNQIGLSSDVGAFTDHVDASHADRVDIPDAELLFRGHFARSGSDLILTGQDGHRFVVTGYFDTEKHPDLIAPTGAHLYGDVIDLLVGSPAPGQYAQTKTVLPPEAIGKVEKVVGQVTVIHNGVADSIRVGDPIYKTDIVETAANSSCGIAFPDGTALDLVNNTRMALNEYNYEANSASNGALFSLVEGTFAFVAGHVAHTGEGLKINTPIATMGVRGTVGLFRSEPAVIGSNLGHVWSVLLHEDIDGSHHLGRIALIDQDPRSPTFGQTFYLLDSSDYIAHLEAQGAGHPPLVRLEPNSNAKAFETRHFFDDLSKIVSAFRTDQGNQQSVPGAPGSGDNPTQIIPPPQLQENGDDPRFIDFVPSRSGSGNSQTPPPFPEFNPPVLPNQTSQEKEAARTVTATMLADTTTVSETLPSLLSGNENTAIALSGANAITVASNSGDLLHTTLTLSHGTITVGSLSGATVVDGTNGGSTLTLSGTAVQITAALAAASYNGNLNYYGADRLAVTTTDTVNGATTGTHTVDITLAPTTTSGPSVSSFTFAHSGTNLVFTVSATETGGTIETVQIFDTTQNLFLGFATLQSNGKYVLTEPNNQPPGQSVQNTDTLTAYVADNHNNSAVVTLILGNFDVGPAGLAGSPINLALVNPSGANGGPVSVTVAGVPSDWQFNEGTRLANGSWTVQTSDLSTLTVLTAAAYAGALLLNITESWTNADGSIGTTTIADNLEAYAPGTPIFALAASDTLTGAGTHDLFVVAHPIGNDAIYNFNTATDKIDLVDFNKIASFSDLIITDDAGGNAVITLGVGEMITVHGVHPTSITAEDFVFNQTPTVENAGTMTVSDGAVLPLSGTIHNTGTIALDSTGDQTELQIIGDGISLEGGGHVTMLPDAVIFGTSTAGTLVNVDNTISGAGRIGVGDGTLTLINETHGTIDANVPGGAVIVDTGKTVTNEGLLEATNGGTLQIFDPVTGGGKAIVESGTLIFEAQSDMNVIFNNGPNGTGYGELVLKDGGEFSGQISGFSGTASGVAHSDAIDLLGIDYNSSDFREAYDRATGALSMADGANSATLSFNNFGGTFGFASDGHDGVLITDRPAVSGSSVSIGGPGNDTFVSNPGMGAETISNFNSQTDVIELDHFAKVHSVQQLSSLVTTDAHGEAFIDLGHNDSIAIPGVAASYLQAHLQSLVHLH